MAKEKIELNTSLKRSKELAAQYSQFPIVKLGVWKDLREKQKLIKERMNNVKGS